jgi:hypothetical protein
MTKRSGSSRSMRRQGTKSLQIKANQKKTQSVIRKAQKLYGGGNG